MTERLVSGELVSAAVFAPPDMSLLAEQLVASAAQQGVQLTGADGFLTALTRQVLQAALEVEMADHLGFDKGDRAGRGAGNIRAAQPWHRGCMHKLDRFTGAGQSL
jgi:putative transposase